MRYPHRADEARGKCDCRHGEGERHGSRDRHIRHFGFYARRHDFHAGGHHGFPDLDAFGDAPGYARHAHGHAHGMLRAGRHFFERLYDRMTWHAVGHHGRPDGPGRHGFGAGDGFGGMGGFGDGDGDGFTRGRKVSSQDLQLLLLAMLAEKPAHGYELIKAIETLSNGFYTPSPGMIYPALTYLEELGQLSVTQEGNRKSYTLSEAGREFLAQNQARVDRMLAKLAHIGAKMDSMRRAYSGESAGDDDSDTWLPALREAKDALKSALRQRSNASKDEQKRIAEILLQATRAIIGK